MVFDGGKGRVGALVMKGACWWRKTVTKGGCGRGAVWRGVFQNLGERFQGEHVEVEEGGCLLIYCLLKAALSVGSGGKIAYAARGYVVLGKGVH